VVVNGEAISESTLADLVAEVRAVSGVPDGANGASLNRQVITGLVQTAVINEVAEQAGVTVTQSQIDDLVDSAAKSAGGLESLQKSLAEQYSVAPSQIDEFARTNLQYSALSEKLGNGDPNVGSEKASALIGAASVDLGVSVNPRFGEWAARQLTVEPPPDVLSAPAGAPQGEGVPVPLPVP
jgi:hypothetical protein